MAKKKRRARRENRPQPGASPGTLLIAEERPTQIQLISYGDEDYREQPLEGTESLQTIPRDLPVVWINVEEPGTEAVLSRLGELFGLHRLALEDVLTDQRPKLDKYPDHLVLTTRMPLEGGREFEQLTLVLGNRFVLTFQGGVPGDCLEPVRQRLRQKQGVIRSRGASYLAYAILDAVIDSFFPVVDALGERIAQWEGEVLALSRSGGDTVRVLRSLRRRAHGLVRVLRPMLDSVAALSRDEAFLQEETRPYLRDCHDHLLYMLDLLDSYRNDLSDLMNLYLSSLSNRMNQVMAFLTLVATVFIPLSFIAGVYGMNFDPDVSTWNMPELKWLYGYPMALGLMATMAGLMGFYFWSRGWLAWLLRD